MSRLTMRNNTTKKEFLIDVDDDDIQDAIQKLADYEDKEEQGLLIELPCKVGDTFWELNNAIAEPYIYPRIAHSLQHCLYAKERLGTICFITRSEAEEALARMGGK